MDHTCNVSRNKVEEAGGMCKRTLALWFIYYLFCVYLEHHCFIQEDIHMRERYQGFHGDGGWAVVFFFSFFIIVICDDQVECFCFLH